MEEYKERCDICHKEGGQTHARLFYTKIDFEWKHLCRVCWEVNQKRF